jgi:hypothetical protein
VIVITSPADLIKLQQEKQRAAAQAAAAAAALSAALAPPNPIAPKARGQPTAAVTSAPAPAPA